MSLLPHPALNEEPSLARFKLLMARRQLLIAGRYNDFDVAIPIEITERGLFVYIRSEARCEITSNHTTPAAYIVLADAVSHEIVGKLLLFTSRRN